MTGGRAGVEKGITRGLQSRNSGAVDNSRLWALCLAAGLIRHPPPPSAKEPPEALAPAHVLRA